MASVCEKCGNKDDYNFALNIGLCNGCIGEQLEQLQAEVKKYKIANDKLQTKLKKCNEFNNDRCPSYMGGNKCAEAEDYQKLEEENKYLREGIGLAIDYLPECPDKAKSFLKGALKGE